MSWRIMGVIRCGIGLLAAGGTRAAGATGAAVAQEPLVSDRPDFTESAATVAPVTSLMVSRDCGRGRVGVTPGAPEHQAQARWKGYEWRR